MCLKAIVLAKRNSKCPGVSESNCPGVSESNCPGETKGSKDLCPGEEKNELSCRDGSEKATDLKSSVQKDSGFWLHQMRRWLGGVNARTSYSEGWVRCVLSLSI